MIAAVGADCVLDRSEPWLFGVTGVVAANELEALGKDEGVIDRWLSIESQRRARGGLDPNLVRRDIDYLAVADQKRGAAELDASP
jgi:hypothetical protein